MSLNGAKSETETVLSLPSGKRLNRQTKIGREKFEKGS